MHPLQNCDDAHGLGFLQARTQSIARWTIDMGYTNNLDGLTTGCTAKSEENYVLSMLDDLFEDWRLG